MPGWSEILNEATAQADFVSALSKQKSEYYRKLHEATNRNIIAYYSGWMVNPTSPDVAINDKDKNAFMSTIHKMDKEKGLDLILHTPGGDVAATESIIDYIHSIFDGDIRAIIPQISMSAGTMIALSCKEIIMGKQSCLGPIDPQMHGLACQAILDEFEDAKLDISKNPHSLGLWQAIVSKYPPTFIIACKKAVEWSEEIARKWLKEMQPHIDIGRVLDKFLNHRNSKAHNRHISINECKEVGLKIVDMEADQVTQDYILSLHHCYMILLERTSAVKIVENHFGGCFIVQSNNQISKQ